jgi:uncharacterized membrane protein YkvA (DUF1232 family)
MAKGSNTPSSFGFFGELVENGRLAWRLLLDRRVPSVLKFVIPGVMGAYVLMPIDLLPDFVPILGQLDDLAVLALAVRLFIQLSPKPIVDELRFGLAQGTAQGVAQAEDTAETGKAPKEVEGDYRVVG